MSALCVRIKFNLYVRTCRRGLLFETWKYLRNDIWNATRHTL